MPLNTFFEGVNETSACTSVTGGSLALSRDPPEDARLGGGTHFLFVYTVFAHIEALALDSQHQISVPPAYLPLIIDLMISPGPRSEAPDLGVIWEPQRTPRRPPEDPQEAPRKLPGSSRKEKVRTK